MGADILDLCLQWKLIKKKKEKKNVSLGIYSHTEYLKFDNMNSL